MKVLNRYVTVLLAMISLLELATVVQVPDKDKDKVVAGAERAFERASKTHTGPGPGVV